MASLSLPRPQGRFHDLPLAVKSIGGFWLFYLLTILLRSALVGRGVTELLNLRTLGVLLGVLLTFGVYLALRLFASHGSLRRMIIVAALACLPVAAAFATFNLNMLFLSSPVPVHSDREIAKEKTRDGTIITRTESGEIRVAREGAKPATVIRGLSQQEMLKQIAPRFIADNTVTWYFFFAAWAAFYVAMTSANQLRLAERRASDFQRAAQAAQIRALRYQVNPHFLFNTLNSLSSLIMGRREEEAEKMVMNLSNFFRSTLSTDPTADVSLAEEIKLQMLYLDIEKARFPKRLKVDIQIPEELKAARVPALILQPIVENAIKYGVARTRDAVTLGIRAEGDGDNMMRIIVENDGETVDPESVQESHGTGVGLPNVCQRLAARFGDNARCDYGPRSGGGFRVALMMPLVLQ